MTANHKNRHIELMILVFSYVWEDARVWAYWNHSRDAHFNYLALVSCFPSLWIPLGFQHRGSYPGWWLYGHNIPCLLKWQVTFFLHRLTCYYNYCETTPELFGWTVQAVGTVLLLLLSRFSRVRSVRPHRRQHTRLPPSLGFSRQEHWSGLLFPSAMHESEKWKWSHSVMSNS